MNRRKFITLPGGAVALACLLAFGTADFTSVSAQEAGRTYKIGSLSVRPHTAAHFLVMLEELQRAGFVENRNLQLLRQGWGVAPGLFARAATELVNGKIDVMLAGGDDAVRAAQQATSTLPILAVADDVLGSGLASSLARTGSNITGVSLVASDLNAKRLELLHECVPQARRIGVLADPTTVSTRAELAQAAARLGVELVSFDAAERDEIDRALDAITVGKVEAVNVLASPRLNLARERIMAHMRAARVPAIYQWPEIAEDGGLLAYGPSQVQIYRDIVARQLVSLLRGAKPGDLPIEQPTRFELVLNIKTARALALEIPPNLIARADKVIE